ncbi:MAG: PTS transporter subunit EIIC [Coriobacteriaceae bacterium]|nr:PTS transporter subunit EIIC [Coriobacteriaceae bacterium]
MADNAQIARDVLAAVGGKENVRSVQHCMTRLRFNLVDESSVNDEDVKAVKGAMGVAKQGGQYQVIIGTNVPEVYAELTALAGLEAAAAVEENLDTAAEKPALTPKSVIDSILNYLSGSVVPLIPVLVGGALFKTLAAIFGPTLLNIVPADSNFIFLCNMVYNAAFYFMPIIAGFAAANKLGINGFLGAFMGAILIEPSFVALAGTEGAAFSVLGIPAPLNGYAQTLIPVLLCVAFMAPINKFLNAKMPASVRTIFAPFITMVIMMPLAMCALAPLGDYIGKAISGFFFWLAGTPLGFLAVTVIAALWPALVMTGMHVGMAAIALADYAATGTDTMLLLAATVQAFTASGVALAVWLRMKDPEQKNLALGYFITQFIGGVGEPLLYGVFLRYKRPWIASIIGGAVSGLYAAFTGVILYTPVQGIFSPLSFLGGSTANMVNGCIAIALGMIVSFVVAWFVALTPAQMEGKE